MLHLRALVHSNAFCNATSLRGINLTLYPIGWDRQRAVILNAAKRTAVDNATLIDLEAVEHSQKYKVKLSVRESHPDAHPGADAKREQWCLGRLEPTLRMESV